MFQLNSAHGGPLFPLEPGTWAIGNGGTGCQWWWSCRSSAVGRRRLATSYSTDFTAFLKSCNLKKSLERLRRAMQSDTQPLESAPLDGGQSPAEPQKTRAQMSQVFWRTRHKGCSWPATGRTGAGATADTHGYPGGGVGSVDAGYIWLQFSMHLCHCQSFCFPGVRCLIDFSILFPFFPIWVGPASSRAII